MQNCILPLALESQFRRRARALLDGNSAVDSTAGAFILRGTVCLLVVARWHACVLFVCL